MHASVAVDSAVSLSFPLWFGITSVAEFRAHEAMPILNLDPLAQTEAPRQRCRVYSKREMNEGECPCELGADFTSLVPPR